MATRLRAAQASPANQQARARNRHQAGAFAKMGGEGARCCVGHVAAEPFHGSRCHTAAHGPEMVLEKTIARLAPRATLHWVVHLGAQISRPLGRLNVAGRSVGGVGLRPVYGAAVCALQSRALL